MTQENRETMQRAIGLIMGACFVAKPSVQLVLQTAIEMLDIVLDDDEEGADQ